MVKFISTEITTVKDNTNRRDEIPTAMPPIGTRVTRSQFGSLFGEVPTGITTDNTAARLSPTTISII